jgi:ectoine hydroxylase-related dioxygenase (phytanoyl-CoA dioxygenase family)
MNSHVLRHSDLPKILTIFPKPLKAQIRPPRYGHSMQLTLDQLRQIQTDGYLILHHFFDAREVRAMQAELNRLVAAGLLRNVATDGDGKTHSTTKQNLQICPLTPKSEFFRALPFHDKVLAVVRQLLGEPVLHHLDQIFLKPGRSGAGTGWHQDNAYFQLPDPTKGLGMWVAMHDATVANGTMHVIPRLFDKPLSHDRDGGSDHHITCAHAVAGYPVVPVEMKAGGALFFNYGVPHCTLGNTTDKERAGLALHFARADFMPQRDGFNGVANKTILLGRGATGGVREFGQKIAGTWETQVARLAD